MPWRLHALEAFSKGAIKPHRRKFPHLAAGAHGGAVAYLARFQTTRATPTPADRLELVYLSSSPVIAKIRF